MRGALLSELQEARGIASFFEMNDAAQEESTKPLPRQKDWLATSSFWLALLIMIWPTEADILDSVFRAKRLGTAVLIFAVCFLIVAVPFFLSWGRVRRNPSVWTGRGYRIATVVILSINLFWFCTILIYQLKSK